MLPDARGAALAGETLQVPCRQGAVNEHGSGSGCGRLHQCMARPTKQESGCLKPTAAEPRKVPPWAAVPHPC